MVREGVLHVMEVINIFIAMRVMEMERFHALLVMVVEIVIIVMEMDIIVAKHVKVLESVESVEVIKNPLSRL